MPTELKGFKCNNCGKVHKEESEAIKCEESHELRMSEAAIYGYIFKPSKFSFNKTPLNMGLVPKTIRVKFSDKNGDVATYTLDHYGYHAV